MHSLDFRLDQRKPFGAMLVDSPGQAAGNQVCEHSRRSQWTADIVGRDGCEGLESLVRTTELPIQILEHLRLARQRALCVHSLADEHKAEPEYSRQNGPLE